MKLNAVTLAALLFLNGCSGGDEPEEPVKAEKEEDVPAETDPKGADEGDTADTTEAEPAEPAGQPADGAAAEESAEPAPTAEPAGFNGPKVWKYVTSFALNVRNSPDKEKSSVIRHVKWGDKVEVVINGEWAKLGPGEYISSKHLSDSDPALKHSKKNKAKTQPKKKDQ